MTLVLAWSTDEDDLYLASDSRVTGGGCWDATSKIFPLRDDSALAWAGDCGAALGSVAAAISLVHGTRWLGDANSTGLDAYIDRVAELMTNVLDSIHGTRAEPGQTAIQEKTSNECEVVVVGIDRMRKPIITHIRRAEDGNLVATRKEAPTDDPLILTQVAQFRG